MIQSTLIDLRANKYGQRLRFYQFTVNLDGCVGRCSTLNDISNTPYVPNTFNIIAG